MKTVKEILFDTRKMIATCVKVGNMKEARELSNLCAKIENEIKWMTAGEIAEMEYRISLIQKQVQP